MGEKEEKGAILFPLHEGQGLVGVPLREGSLVGDIVFDHLVVPHQAKGLHVVHAGGPVEIVEPVGVGQAILGIAQVPFPHETRGVIGVFQPQSQGEFLSAQALIRPRIAGIQKADVGQLLVESILNALFENDVRRQERQV